MIAHMVMPRRAVAPLLLPVLLGACGGGGDAGVSVPPPDATITLPATLLKGGNYAFNEGFSTVELISSGTTRDFNFVGADGSAEGVSLYRSSAGLPGAYVVRGIPASGGARVYVNNINTGIWQVQRLTETDYEATHALVYSPSSDPNERNYTGGYEIRYGDGSGFARPIFGRGQISLKLDRNELTFSISARENDVGATAARLSYETDGIDFTEFLETGTFTQIGTFTGGQFNTTIDPNAPFGRVSGVISGENADEITVAVSFEYSGKDSGGTSFGHFEAGVFNATRCAICEASVEPLAASSP